MKLTVLLFFITFQAQANSDCWQNFKLDTQNQMIAREEKYKSLDSKFLSLSSESLAETKDGASDELVILIHGFLANPNEMREVSKALQQSGFKIYSGLIPGFGATAKIANQFDHSDWINWTENEIDRAKKCFSKIHLVGFSTGATLIHDYVSTHPKDNSIASITMISTYFRTHRLLQAILRGVKWSGAKEVKIDKLMHYLPVSDVQVIIDNPQTYMQTVPVKSLFQVVKLGKINKKRKLKEKLEVPALAIISEEDMVAEPDSAERVLQRNFKDIDIRKFDKPGHVPHQIMASSVSQVAQQVHQVIVEKLSEYQD
jgi:esterase/lipase